MEAYKFLVAIPCYYCGEDDEPMGVDRWNNPIGYVLSNCLPCCYRCNRAKSSMGFSEFIGWLRRVGSHIQHVVEIEVNEDIFEIALNNNAGGR